MSLNITRGKIKSAQKVVLYGPEGIGKTTFASQFPDPVFIDTEGSTKHLDVMRTDPPTSWSMLMQQVQMIKDIKPGRTLVIDTVDWAERLAKEHICASRQFKSIEDPGYGKGYVYLAEEWGKLLNFLEEVIESGTHVVLLAHATMRKFEQPDELGAYDRWELKLEKKTSPMTKEWADMVLFANYKTTIVTDAKTKSRIATGGKRVMYTTHHPAWDAKNRAGLKEELPLGYEAISHLFDLPLTAPKPDPKSETVPETAPEKPTQVPPEQPVQAAAEQPDPEKYPVVEEEHPFKDDTKGIPKELLDLMMTNDVTEEDLSEAAFIKGYQPKGMRIKDMPEDFVKGWFVAMWPQVYQLMIDEGIIVPF